MLRGWIVPSALILTLSVMTVAAETAPIIRSAEYTEPTRRYAHGILGDEIEWGALQLAVATCETCTADPSGTVTIRLPETRVFEDVAPRLIDLDANGSPYAVVVESDIAQGASLAVYNETGRIAATPFIGRANRWLAPLGGADLDGDGAMELAYIDRPHLTKVLRIWRWKDGQLTEVGSLNGLTNHRIGEPDIGGGIRSCGGTPEIIAATADWSRVVAVRFDGETFFTRDVSPYEGRDSFGKALEC